MLSRETMGFEMGFAFGALQLETWNDSDSIIPKILVVGIVVEKIFYFVVFNGPYHLHVFEFPQEVISWIILTITISSYVIGVLSALFFTTHSVQL